MGHRGRRARVGRVSIVCRCGNGRVWCMSNGGKWLSSISLFRVDGVSVCCLTLHAIVAVGIVLSSARLCGRNVPSSSFVRV